MKISVVGPVKNEFPWIGYSIMAALPFVHEFIYAVSPSDDGTLELLDHLKDKAPIIIIPYEDFKPADQKAYNDAFNVCMEASTGDAAWFLHPDMIVTQGAELTEGPLAWWTNMTSFAGDFQTEIVGGRVNQWKNIHAKKFGLHYFGGYGSVNEDFYHRDITGNAYKHYGTDFEKYPFEVRNSGINVNHYCELKSYRRRLEKMQLCLKTQQPFLDPRLIDEMAEHHPRVTLEAMDKRFGNFQFKKTDVVIPEVITKYEKEFASLKGELIHG